MNVRRVTAHETNPPHWRRWLRALGNLLLWTVLLGLNAWAMVALWVDMRVTWLRLPLAAGFAAAVLAVAFCVRRRALAKALCFGASAAVLGWWLCLQPSNDREWRRDVALLPWAETAGDLVTVHHIRNCDYRTETDFDVRHYDRVYDLRKLQSVDFLLVNWGVPLISHTLVSFGFEGGQFLCVSIETRMERGESYSALKGFFRQFELTYVIGDERDLVRLRTNHRQGEEVWLYRVRIAPERGRALLLDYLRRANSLREQPEWYNALTSNCTTNIRLHGQAAAHRRGAFDWRILLNGDVDQFLYERGRFASTLAFAELKKRSHINTAARAADTDPEFSTRIRAGLPGMGSNL